MSEAGAVARLPRERWQVRKARANGQARWTAYENNVEIFMQRILESVSNTNICFMRDMSVVEDLMERFRWENTKSSGGVTLLTL